MYHSKIPAVILASLNCVISRFNCNFSRLYTIFAFRNNTNKQILPNNPPTTSTNTSACEQTQPFAPYSIYQSNKIVCRTFFSIQHSRIYHEGLQEMVGRCVNVSWEGSLKKWEKMLCKVRVVSSSYQFMNNRIYIYKILRIRHS